MTAFTMGVSTLDYNQTAATLNTNGLLFKLYGEHLGAGSIPVAFTGNSPQPAPTQHIVGDLPRTSAGSPTYPLDMVAALSADHKFLTLAVVNATDSEQKFDLNVSGAHLAGNAKLWQMTGKDLDAANHVGPAPAGRGEGNRDQRARPRRLVSSTDQREYLSLSRGTETRLSRTRIAEQQC